MQPVLLAFTAVALVTTITPGPAVLFTIQNATLHGRSAAWAGALGNAAGLLLVSVCALAGVTALLQQSTLWFSLLKTGGAAYLIYLAWLQWQQASGLNRPNPEPQAQTAGLTQHADTQPTGQLPSADQSTLAAITQPVGDPPQNTTVRPRDCFSRGVLVALTNPKAWLFVSALFPQFVSAQQPAVPQFVLLTLIFIGCSLLAHGCWLSLVQLGMRHGAAGRWRPQLARAQALLLGAVGCSLWWSLLPA